MNNKKTHVISEKKQTFLIRTSTSCLILFIYLIFFVQCAIADRNWIPEINMYVKFWFAISFIFSIFFIGYFAFKELSNLIFVNKKTQIYLYIIFSLYFLAVTLPYLLFSYGIISVDINAITLIFVLTLFLGLIISGFLMLLILRLNIPIIETKMNKFILPIIFELVSLTLIFMFYLMIIRSWTTIMVLLILSNGSDVFAYIGGTLFGKHKLCPKISPKKTVEGAVFSIIFTTCFGLLCYYFMSFGQQEYHSSYLLLGVQFGSLDPIKNYLNQYWWYFILFALFFTLILVSMCGDLFYSWIKRFYKIKDFGNLLPGHGGTLDRIDAVTFTFVFFGIIFISLNMICNIDSLFLSVGF